MAVIHKATLIPAKLDAISAWLPGQPWSGVAAGTTVEQAGRFRFDDPDGEVGVETYLVRAGDGPVLHVPLTYRGAPLVGAEAFLVTEMEHSVLGHRWIYDAVGDPVYADVLRRAIATGGHEAELERASGPGTLEKEGRAIGSGTDPASPTVTGVEARADGVVTTVTTDHGTLAVLRVLGSDVPAGATLTAGWGTEHSAVVAVLLP
ncbi:CG0192-related protein [Curtobacterium herbarum]|uniref:Maltokinase N-terminal cap domain-containing protein n=1 Tax=Curtobacterium herbarum TaxID=150122 RepID=A0ABP4K2B8_9MICO|nr:hypothetical protein [Curtobacterium herbarum]MBM7473947.1 hypothetical protein [Curtobacterium herbarum]MCS6544726.1 hypothetical protein [Curtobacterium herbarum]